jgi:hypothetical protein
LVAALASAGRGRPDAAIARANLERYAGRPGRRLADLAAEVAGAG